MELFAAHRLQTLSEIRADEVKSLLGRLSRNCGDNKDVDMKMAFFEMMLNVMMRMIAGKSFYGEKVVETEEARHFQEIVVETFRVAGNNNADFLPFLCWFGGFEKRVMALKEKRNNFSQGLIEEIRKKKAEFGDSDDYKGKEKTMVDVLLSLQETEPEYYTDETIRGIMTVVLSAGTDTSVGTMEWTLSLLLNHPCILKKAQKEIDEQVGHDRLINELDLAHLPYLRCVMNEAMRMYLVAPLLVPHESSKECTVGGYRIPRGTMLLVNMWAIQNSPDIWDEPSEFRPERFEGLDGSRDGFKFVPFGSGRRSCPGEGLALRMVGLALGSVIQCFDWERPSKEMIDLSEEIGLTMPKAKPLVAKCQPRPIMANLLSQI